jgi:hypothetical protein
MIFPAQGNGDAGARVERICNELRCAANSFINAGLDLREAFAAQEWITLRLPNFAAYCAQFDISVSLGYDLMRIADIAGLFPQYRARMLDAGISKMRLLLPQLGECVSADDKTASQQLDTLLDMANEKSWNELRREMHAATSDAPLASAVEYCPACGVKLHLSRAARLEIAKERNT